jgi:hypothetical protein
MMRKILTYAEAHEIVSPMYDTLADCIQSSFAEHLAMCDLANQFGRPVSYENRTKANIIHDHLKSHVAEKFTDSKIFEVDKWNNIFGVKVNDDIFIRFNKINENRKISCRKTNQYINYMRQGEIQGFPPSPTLLFAGYLPDENWTSIRGIYLLCPDNEDILHWSYELDRRSSSEQLSVFERNEGRKRKVKLKLTDEEIYRTLNIKKSGTNDSV